MAKPINKQHAKTIHRILTGMVGVNGVTVPAGNSMDITSALSNVLLTAGWHSNAVPLQVQADVDTQGVRVLANNRLEVIEAASLSPIKNGDGLEIYAVLSEASGTYTLDFKVYENGTETAVAVPAGDYNFTIPYAFKFEDYPIDGMVNGSTSAVGDDPINKGGRFVQEEIAVTATNTLADTTFTPIPGSFRLSTTPGHLVSELQSCLSILGKAITWISDDDSYDLETTDKVYAFYQTFE